MKKAYVMYENEKYFVNSLRYASCHAALSPLRSSGRITRDIRFGARLAPHPNFAPFSRKTSYIPDVMSNSEFGLTALMQVPSFLLIFLALNHNLRKLYTNHHAF